MSNKQEFLEQAAPQEPLEITLTKGSKPLTCKVVPVSLESRQKLVSGASLDNGKIDLALYTALTIIEHTVEPKFTKEDIPMLKNKFPVALLDEWSTKILQVSGLIGIEEIKKKLEPTSSEETSTPSQGT